MFCSSSSSSVTNFFFSSFTTAMHYTTNDSINNEGNGINIELIRDRMIDQSVKEAARELLKNYQRKAEFQKELEEEYDDDDDDDAASYASSDLFELDNLNNDRSEKEGKYVTYICQK